MDNRQYEEGGIGMLGSITHLDDGDVPQETLAVVGKEETLPKSRWAKIVDGEFEGA